MNVSCHIHDYDDDYYDNVLFVLELLILLLDCSTLITQMRKLDWNSRNANLLNQRFRLKFDFSYWTILFFYFFYQARSTCVKSLNKIETEGSEFCIVICYVIYFSTQESVLSLCKCICDVCLYLCHKPALILIRFRWLNLLLLLC